MLIKVTEKGFVWISPTNKTQVAKKLWGPESCRYERLQIVRNGDVIDEAYIHIIGTHGSYECFEGLEKISKAGRYHNELGLNFFQVGDELHISDIPDNISEFDYWNELCLRTAIELPL